VCGKPCRPGRRTHTACRKQQAQRRNHRAAALRAGPRVCAVPGCERTDVESAHVVDLADNGPHEWTRLLCTEHHKAETRERRRAKMTRQSQRPRARGVSEEWGERDRQRPARRRGRLVVPLVLVAMVWSVAAVLYGIDRAAAGAVAAGAALAVLARWRRHRRLRDEGRARMRQRVASVASMVTRTPPEQIAVSVLRWDQALPLVGSIRYAHTFNDAQGSPDRAVLEESLTRKVGVPLDFTWLPAQDTVMWSVGDDSPTPAPVAEGDVARPDRTVTQVRRALSSYMRSDDVTVVAEGDPDAIGPRVLVVSYPETFRDDDDAARAVVARRVNAKAHGRWKAEWDTEGNQVRFVRRPHMPSKVVRPVVEPGAAHLPVGVDEHGDPVDWDLTVAPHMLIAGETGSGKTVQIRGLVMSAAQAGMDVRCVDPKRVELSSLRHVPGVREVATTTEDMIRVVDEVWALMEERYVDLEAEQVRLTDLRTVLLVLDEQREWLERVNREHKASKGTTGPEHPVVEKFRSIARLGRKCRIHVVVGTQRPDAKMFGGEARDNFSARVACGAMSKEGATMMWGRVDVGRDIPTRAKGRMTVDLGDEPIEVQGYWVPDPGEDLTEEERDVLASLMPAPSPHRARRALTQAPPKTQVGETETTALDPRLAGASEVTVDGTRYSLVSVEADPDADVVEMAVVSDGTEMVLVVPSDTPVVVHR
jgi:hypothetical protein